MSEEVLNSVSRHSKLRFYCEGELVNEVYEKQYLIMEYTKQCLLPLGAEPFVFQFAFQTFKDQDI